jgi:two-component system KDP operon response regulator KdpE
VLSVRGEEEAKVASLDSGADDYITKPFNINELEARVRASLRRGSGPTRKEEEERKSKIEAGDFSINLLTRLVTVRGQEVRLTPKEFDLLCYLAKNPSRVITHSTILSSLWGEAGDQKPAYLHVLINHLRKKIEPEDGSFVNVRASTWLTSAVGL